MKPLVTVVIPVGLMHQHLAPRAIQSARNQTVRVDTAVYVDHEGKGAGYARNAAAKQVYSDWMVFLDADDTIEPEFVERCLGSYRKGTYVYTAWNAGIRVVRPAHQNPYSNNGYHLVTTLFPTAAFKALGGFDENLPGHEDADFHLRAAVSGVCPVYVDEPLVNYSPAGERSKQFIARPDYQDIRKLVYERNGGEAAIMSCCGDYPPIQPNYGEKRDGDVQAVLMWSGIRTEGSATQPGRVYRGGNQEVKWVAPGDIAARPDLFKQVYDVGSLTPDAPDVLTEAGLF